MNIDELRAIQAPIKERYRKDPSSARIASRAEGRIDGDDIDCRVDTHLGTTSAGLHPATGGDGSKACSADMLLQALVACAGVTMQAVAKAMRLPLKRVKIVAEGTWDARGTLGVDRAAPVGVTDLRLTYHIDSPADDEKLDKLVQLTERYCVIFQTFAHPPALSSRFER